MEEYFGTGFCIISAIVGCTIGSATAYFFYMRHFKTNTNPKIEEKDADPSVYVAAPSEKVDETVFVSPSEGALA